MAWQPARTHRTRTPARTHARRAAQVHCQPGAERPPAPDVAAGTISFLRYAKKIMLYTQ